MCTGFFKFKHQVDIRHLACLHILGPTFVFAWAGARCVATLLHEMKKRGKDCRYGVVSMCIGVYTSPFFLSVQLCYLIMKLSCLMCFQVLVSSIDYWGCHRLWFCTTLLVDVFLGEKHTRVLVPIIFTRLHRVIINWMDTFLGVRLLW